MQFFCFFVSNMRIRASVLLIYSIRFLKFTFPMQIGGRQPRKRQKPASRFRDAGLDWVRFM